MLKLLRSIFLPKEKDFRERYIEVLRNYVFPDVPCKPLGFREYPYAVFSDSNWRGIEFRKTFFNKKQCTDDLFFALQTAQPNFPSEKLPVFLGRIGGRVRLVDLASSNMLVAGRRGSGKTTFLNSLLISLMHYAHPEYLNIVCLDGKHLSFKCLSKVVTVEQNFKLIRNTLKDLVDEMERRYTDILYPSHFVDIRGFNAHIYSNRTSGKVLPYIVVVFDEYQDYISAEKGKKTPNGGEYSNNLERLAAKGRAAGISLVLCTQSPYVEFVRGPIKGNMEHRVSFALSEYQQSQLILGRSKSKSSLCPTELYKPGSFIFRDGAKHVEGRAVLSTYACLRNAAKTLEYRGFDFSFGQKL